MIIKVLYLIGLTMSIIMALGLVVRGMGKAGFLGFSWS